MSNLGFLRWPSLVILTLYWACSLAQEQPVTQLQLFGHMTSSISLQDKNPSSEFSLGEHDFFVQSKIAPRFAFLSETVVGPSNGMGHSGADYKVSIERARIKYEHREWLSIIVGKMHTPVNYWNDVYHHGRLFFPTIDRPQSFGISIPIHTLGLRLQGQNIGKLKFGYDLVIGNGVTSNDLNDENFQKSVTAAIHIRPAKRTRISLSAYRDVLYENEAGSHAGHSGPFHYSVGEANWHPVDLDFEFYNFSVYHNKGKWEVLFEATLNSTELREGNDPELTAGLDTLGKSANTTLFVYAGYKISKRDRLYVVYDRTDYEERDLHIKSNQLTRAGLGWQHEFSPLLKTQVQIERNSSAPGREISSGENTELKLRIAYCLF